jgi:superfamily II DNA or RNA helicase
VDAPEGRMRALRPYQITAVEAAVRELRARRRALLVMATGSGKTVCFAFIAEHWRPGGRVLVLAHREELLRQAADKIAALIESRFLSRRKTIVTTNLTLAAIYERDNRIGSRLHEGIDYVVTGNDRRI